MCDYNDGQTHVWL